MFRVTFGLFALVLLASGCCGPMGCGPGCDVGGCYDCDGTATAGAYGHPFESLVGLRKRIVCGSGCGETYHGEWMSTPPDCEDPCQGDQFVGGAVKARPFCWAPGTIWGALVPSLYGGRFCDSCGESFCRMRLWRTQAVPIHTLTVAAADAHSATQAKNQTRRVWPDSRKRVSDPFRDPFRDLQAVAEALPTLPAVAGCTNRMTSRVGNQI